jgi:hypothetical protein
VRGMRSLVEIAGDYARAEVTAVWIHDRPSDERKIAFAVAELCPADQPMSAPIVATGAAPVVPRELLERKVSSDRKAYASRWFVGDPLKALEFFRGAGNCRVLENHGVLLRSFGSLTDEPPNEVPLLLGSGDNACGLYEQMLPYRHSSLRVVSKFSSADAVDLSQQERNKLSAFAREVIGVDFAKFPEHLGAIHLCFSNPIIRSMSPALSKEKRHLLVEFFERTGASIAGCTLHLVDHRLAGIGFDFSVPVTSARMVVALPNSPERFQCSLMSKHGECVEDGCAPFLHGVQINMAVVAETRVLSVASGHHVIPTHDWQISSVGSEASSDLLSRLRSAQERRALDDLEKSRQFFYFPGGADSRQKARGIIREILSGARERCLLCDTYLSAADVIEYVPFVQTRRLRIRMLGSNYFLKKRPDQTMSRGEQLLKQIQGLATQDPSLILECRVLKGKKSPIHDRFLVVDRYAYLPGSSLNAIGLRATTLFRVPDPERIAAELEGWWNDNRRTVALEDWVANPEGDDDGAE